jgi:centromere protein C
MKTNLLSSPRRHPSLGPQSSPMRGDIETPSIKRGAHIARTLDFAAKPNILSRSPPQLERTPVKRTPHKQARGSAKSQRSSSDRKRTIQPVFELNDDIDQDPEGDNEQDDGDGASREDSFQPVDYDEEPTQNMSGGSPSEVLRSYSEEEEPAEMIDYSPEPPKATKQAAKRGRGRPPKLSSPVLGNDEPLARPPKRSRQENGEEQPKKKSKTAKEPAIEKKQRGRPRKENNPAQPTRKPRPEVSSPAEVKHMPPRPKRHHGLFLQRREAPGESSEVKQTRSGRNSIKPLAYWKNEKIEWNPSEDIETKVSLLTIKEVTRVDELSPERKRHAGSRSKSKAKRKVEESEDEEFEPWEEEPGRIQGDIRVWDPEDATGMESQEQEEEIAISASAIVTRPVAGSSFTFAKTLNLDFFGTGMVDIPPQGMKKMKNSRKMQMVFFVHEGKVKVVVNDTEFRISKGGMWQVPRGMS